MTNATPQTGLLDWLKPRRSVAIARLRQNGFALAIALVITQLAPVVPSPLTCLWLLVSDGRGLSGFVRWMCWIGKSVTPEATLHCLTPHTELLVFTILGVNILQAYWGLKYPLPPSNPLESPAKRAQAKHLPSAPPPRTVSSLVRPRFSFIADCLY